jgi:hypothetical protein
MSYGRSSLIVTLTWVGLLLRVYHEAVVNARGPATTRGRTRRSQEDVSSAPDSGKALADEADGAKESA